MSRLRQVNFTLGPVKLRGRSRVYNPKQVWKQLEKVLNNNGLIRKVACLINTSLDASVGVEGYMNKIMTAHKLRNIGIEVSDEGLGTLKLADIKATYRSKGPRCFNCNKHGHFAKFCCNPKKTLNKEHSKGESSNFILTRVHVCMCSILKEMMLWPI